jgi:hypothetical protein
MGGFCHLPANLEMGKQHQARRTIHQQNDR